VIIIEDDMEISPDFFDYFQATFSLLMEDPTIYCVSAWADNGQEQLVQNSSA
jgi:alpha-1,3-mannosyl-glycoprotein beta-1,2-N-acetylglucosaminyltransferase